MKSKISIILVLLLNVLAFSQSDIKVISSDRNSLVIEYTPSYADSTVAQINNENYINVGLVNGYIRNSNQWGSPAVPVRLINVGVPAEFGNTIQILSSAYKEIKGKIIPVPKPDGYKNVNKSVYEINDKYLTYKNSEELVSFGKYGLSRSVPTQQIIISPVKFFAAQKRIQIYTKIIFRINFSSAQTFSSKPVSNLLENSIVNFSVAKYWTVNNVNLKKGIFNSVLSTGKWVRVETTDEGIYRITKAMMSDYGFDVDNLDPRTIKIYNNGGKVLPEDFNSPRPSDLQENAIMVVGQNDGNFDDSDYILFYGRGNDFWDYDTTSQSIKRYHHWYSNKNYYWITVGGANGKRIQDEASLNTSIRYIQTSTKSFVDWDDDKKNVGGTGREYFGDSFTESNPSNTYTNKLDGLIQGSTITYKCRFANISQEGIGLQVTENNTQIYSTYINGYITSLNYLIGIQLNFTTTYSGVLPDNRSVLKFTITPGTKTSEGYLDYFEIYYDRNLSAAGDYLSFFSKDTTSVIEYPLSGFSSSNIMVFNVTDYANVKEITNPVLLSGGNFTFQSSEVSGSASHYIAVTNNNFKTPANPVSESNSNLHGIAAGARFIIITNKDFISAANRLKTYRETQAKIKISTIVIDVAQIFNEFSGGLLDVSAVRDFIKYAYDNWQTKPEYVLFLGKGTYDYKNVEDYNNNYVPVYETQESLDEINSYTSDDFFVNVSGNDSFIDLAPGRITAQTLDEANSAVDKIINYETNSPDGTWRNLITLVADDGYRGNIYEGAEHTAPSETLANSIIPPSFDLNKIYMAAYPIEITGDGKRMPTVNTAIVNAINQGTFILNYIGHGSPSQWAHEDVFNQATSLPMLHNDKYFFLTAATCDFGNYDKTNSVSTAEDLLFMKNSGCIASFTATRPVFSSLNHALIYQFFNDLLNSGRDTLNLIIPLGKALFATKQVYNGVNDQKYHIIGDPTLRLVLPEYSANIDSVNGNNIAGDSAVVQVKALSNTKINGTVLKSNNSPWNNFTGEGILTVFDSQSIVPLPEIGNYPMVVQGGVIFRGRISVSNGKFSTNFVVPKDISYENQNGKIIFYFFNNNVDGIGFTNKIIIGGTDSTTVNDGKGPNIEIFFDDIAYGKSTLINSNSTLLVKISDETGLNTTGTGVGHKFVGILNGDENNPIDFTNYFTSDINSNGKSGEIKYPLSNLSAGNYSLEVKAWDVFNNFSDAKTNFIVVSDSELVVRDVYNYPNPFTSKTTFTFQQNLNKLLDVKIKVYTVAGRLIRQIEKMNVNDKFVKVPWDGRDQDGSPIANGTYLYKIIVRTADGSYNKSVLGKLAVVR